MLLLLPQLLGDYPTLIDTVMRAFSSSHSRVSEPLPPPPTSYGVPFPSASTFVTPVALSTKQAVASLHLQQGSPKDYATGCLLSSSNTTVLALVSC